MRLPLDRDTVLAAFQGDRTRILKVKELGEALGIHHTERSALRQLVRALVAEGDLIAHPGRRFALPGEGSLVEGRVQRNKRGFGWLLPDDDEVHDAFLPPDEIVGLMDGDRVLCRISPAKKGPVGKVMRVLSRARRTVTGTLRVEGRARWVETQGTGLGEAIRIPPGEEGGADGIDDGIVVEVLIVRYPTHVTSPVGRVVRTLGREGEISVEVERLVSEAGIVRPFSPETEAEAAALPPEPTEEDAAGRKDLTEIALCTIDGETAKDFDDAVFAEPAGPDLRVVVAIADVAHYVRPGSALDEDAYARGTSVYYPGSCIPMLPEALSNGLCSLRPEVTRLCMVADFVVTKSGRLKSKRFYNGVMRSQARLTYAQVQSYIDGDRDAEMAIPGAVKESLGHLRTAAQWLRKARMKRGSLDFDLRESQVETDERGEPVAIRAIDRRESHRLIEDLMIAANEAVASHLEARDHPCIYRIHEPPDAEKLERFLRLAKSVVGKGANLQGPVSGRQLQQLMDRLSGQRVQSALEFLLLRAMMQARYSADNVGHFGLGSEAYAHFTSPIRRYPDLIVHRQLKRHLKQPKKRWPDDKLDAENERLEEVAAESSDLERRAIGAERKIDALYAAWFMRERVGETFTGTVSGVAEFACWIRFDSPEVEGQVSVNTLGQELWDYDEITLRLFGQVTGFSIGIGDRVEVEITTVDLAARKIVLRLLKVIEREGRQVESLPPGGDGEAAGGPAADQRGGDRPGFERMRAEHRRKKGGQDAGERKGKRGRGAGRGKGPAKGGSRGSSRGGGKPKGKKPGKGGGGRRK